MLEKEFYKLVTPEGKQNYVLEGQAKLLLLLCQEVDKLVAAQQSVQRTGESADDQDYSLSNTVAV